jgi:ABC-type polysaccharide/polyol phosphate transport system ATPase subunit
MHAIEMRGVGKRYALGQRLPYGALRDVIARTARRPFRRPAESDQADIWALRDVSLTIDAGEVVGIVGRNGSGKSTLLKVLSRITDPTAGEAAVRGRVGSLLEVGTGFHPELTGRENVFLNGAILGMRRAEITRKFDEVVAFAEVDRFLDTPVKYYSSGMQMRLAFSVAAHLDPDILFVDEVLAVGDAAFQQKCLGKMDDVRQGGRTVLVVSHQLTQLRRLCSRVVWLNAGRVAGDGPTAEVLAAYQASFGRGVSRAPRDQEGKPAGFSSWHFGDARHGAGHELTVYGPVSVSFTLDVTRPLANVHHGIALLSSTGQNLWGTARTGLALGEGRHVLTHRLPALPVQPGVCYWQVSLYTDHAMIDLWDCLPECVISLPPMTHYRDEYAGVLNFPSEFDTATLDGQPATVADHASR